MRLSRKLKESENVCDDAVSVLRGLVNIKNRNNEKEQKCCESL